MKIFFLSMITALALMGCAKDEGVTEKDDDMEPKQAAWAPYDFFTDDFPVQLNSAATDETLYFIGANGLMYMNPLSEWYSDPYSASTSRYVQQVGNTGRIKFPLSPDFVSAFDDKNDRLILTSTKRALLSGGQVIIDMKKLDSDFWNLGFVTVSKGESMAINSAGQTLVTYTTRGDEGLTLRLALIDVQVDAGMIDTLRTQVIRLDADASFRLESIQSIGTDFYVSTTNSLYRIDQNGTASRVLQETVSAMISVGSLLYAQGPEMMYISRDNGLSWEEAFAVPRELRNILYTTFRDKIIGYKIGKLWEVTLTETGVSVRELDAKHLEGRSITSLIEFKDYLFLTTMEGVFFKKPSELFQDAQK